MTVIVAIKRLYGHSFNRVKMKKHGASVENVEVALPLMHIIAD